MWNETVIETPLQHHFLHPSALLTSSLRDTKNVSAHDLTCSREEYVLQQGEEEAGEYQEYNGISGIKASNMPLIICGILKMSKYLSPGSVQKATLPFKKFILIGMEIKLKPGMRS